ncbi:hypothetical protein [Litchfieldia salsa]|uniref:DNA mismatch repair protein MutT n=1 Tax=Litchfieldia salsa TaxID=930152 RepID=A0A1H0TKC7_9BACI|nr:hypothetical protein [Litchfieldia salsa]SDP54110.1 hypothetical protein SAMN05216565_103565 [Litchfieldia salsa]
MQPNSKNTKQYSDTNIEEVKKLNAQSGLSYNEVLALLAMNYERSRKHN